MDWFLYDRDLRHEGVNPILLFRNTLAASAKLPTHLNLKLPTHLNLNLSKSSL